MTEPWVPYSPQPTVGRRMSSFITSWMVISTSLEGWPAWWWHRTHHPHPPTIWMTREHGELFDHSYLWLLIKYLTIKSYQILVIVNRSWSHLPQPHARSVQFQFFCEFAESMVTNRFGFWVLTAKSLTLPEFDPRREYHQPGTGYNGYKEIWAPHTWFCGIQWVMRSTLNGEMEVPWGTYLHPTMHSPGGLLDTFMFLPQTMRDLKTELEAWA